MSVPSTTPPTPTSLDDLSAPPLHRFSVEEYYAAGQAGVFGEQRVELLQGLIVDMSPIGARHALSYQRLLKVLNALNIPQVHIRGQLPMSLGASEPQPDVAIVRGQMDDYPIHHPGPGDVLLVVEIAETSLRVDRKSKTAIYAAAGIPEYWIVNLIDRQVEIYRQPSASAYTLSEALKEQDQVPVVIEGVEVGRILIQDLLP